MTAPVSLPDAMRASAKRLRLGVEGPANADLLEQGASTVEAIADALETMLAHDGSRGLFDAAKMYDARQRGEQALAAYRGEAATPTVSCTFDHPFDWPCSVCKPATPAKGGERLDRPARVAGRDFHAGDLIQRVVGRAHAHYDAHHYGHNLPATPAGGGDLPELPEGEQVMVRFTAMQHIAATRYTADQMRAYGQQCRLASTQAPAGGGDLPEDGVDVEGALRILGQWATGSGIQWHDGQRVHAADIAILIRRLASTGRAPAPSAVLLDRGFKYENGIHMPTVLVGFPGDWNARDRFAATLAAPTPEPQASNDWTCKCGTVNPTFDPWCSSCEEPQA